MIEVTLFEMLRHQALERELQFYKTTRILVTHNKLRNEDVWDAREAEQTAVVLRELDVRIMNLEHDLMTE